MFKLKLIKGDLYKYIGKSFIFGDSKGVSASSSSRKYKILSISSDSTKFYVDKEQNAFVFIESLLRRIDDKTAILYDD